MNTGFNNFSVAETVLKTRPVLEIEDLKDPKGAGRVFHLRWGYL